jgi:hypothetical protein
MTRGGFIRKTIGIAVLALASIFYRAQAKELKVPSSSESASYAHVTLAGHIYKVPTDVGTVSDPQAGSADAGRAIQFSLKLPDLRVLSTEEKSRFLLSQEPDVIFGFIEDSSVHPLKSGEDFLAGMLKLYPGIGRRDFAPVGDGYYRFVPSNPYGEILYFKDGGPDGLLAYNCMQPRAVPHPRCMIYKGWPGGIRATYSVDSKYSQRIYEIDQKLRSLFSSFKKP